MKQLLRKLQGLLGIDGAISYTILGKGVGVITTVFTVFFIARYLSPDEQGYYYTFASILSIQVFFELGLNNIITQFVAHEASYLTLNAELKFEGPERNKSRLADLLRFCVKWYAIFAVIMLVALLIVGVFFFKKYSDVEGVTWRLPWILLATSSVINFLTAPINSFMQGLGKVKEIAAIRFFQQLVIPIVVWGGLMFGAKLFVSGLQTTLVVLVNVFYYYKYSFIKLLVNILKQKITDTVRYMQEIFPYQWKIALSWISGYFTFQLFNPILFAAEGAASAGRMGMTITAASAIQGVLLSWINTKVPLFSGLIEQRKFKELDSVFSSNLKKIICLSLFLFTAFVLFVYGLQNSTGSLLELGNRFTSLLPLIIMSISIGLQIPVTSWATYLRCFLKEPFLVNSVTLGILSLVVATFVGPRYGTMGLAIGYLCVQLISVLWARYIYVTKKKEYQK
mgnify:CR=1 FL=1